MYENLKIIHWPDPRLLKAARPVEVFNQTLEELAGRMFGLMREHKGVGLAAPQVGLGMRLFVANATGEPGDDRVYVNPELSEPAGEEEDEEGCLSLPNIRANVVRSKSIHIRAFDLTGRLFEQEASGFLARIWQHEHDHLNGTLIVDRMGPVARLVHRKKLRELREQFDRENPPPPPPGKKPPKRK